MNEDFPFEHFVKINKSAFNTPLNVGKNQEFHCNFEELDKSKFEKDEIKDINHKIIDQLHNSVPEKKFEIYFKNNFYLLELEYNKICFAVGTDFIKNLIENHYDSQLKDAVRNVLGGKYTIELKVIATNESLSSNDDSILKSLKPNFDFMTNKVDEHAFSHKSKSVSDASFSLDLTPNEEDLKDTVESKYIEHVAHEDNNQIDFRKTFETFVVGPSNNMSYASCFAVSKNPGKSYPTVYLHSKSGLGKTHLLHAIANQIKADRPQLRVTLVTAQNFLEEMVDSIREKRVDDFKRRYTIHTDVLLIDDIHELKGKQATQNAFFHIFNELYNKGKQLVFTSDKMPKEIDGIEERIKTRLSWGLVLDIQQPDLETRIAILKRKAKEEDAYFQDDVLHLIASSIKDNIRELEGSLIKLIAYQSIFKQDIDIEIAKKELKLENLESQKELSIDKVAKAVSLYYRVPIADMKSKSRMKDVATARHVAMFLAYKLTKTNYKCIGDFFGKRDHSTVLIGVRKIKDAIKSDQSLSNSVLEIENNL